MTRGKASLPASYFEDIFRDDDDPWNLRSSQYESDKHDHTISVLPQAPYDQALEVGCAGGTLTRRLAAFCKHLLAIDISEAAIQQAKSALGDLPSVELRTCAFPEAAPDRTVDLLILSEVVYYWSDDDIAKAARWMIRHVRTGGDLLLVHWTGQTDYPQQGDRAVEVLAAHMAPHIEVLIQDRTPLYRLDLWRRR